MTPWPRTYWDQIDLFVQKQIQAKGITEYMNQFTIIIILACIHQYQLYIILVPKKLNPKIQILQLKSCTFMIVNLHALHSWKIYGSIGHNIFTMIWTKEINIYENAQYLTAFTTIKITRMNWWITTVKNSTENYVSQIQITTIKNCIFNILNLHITIARFILGLISANQIKLHVI